MVAIPLSAVLAALTFAVCTALDLTPVVGVVSALLVLVAALPTIGERFGPRDF